VQKEKDFQQKTPEFLLGFSSFPPFSNFLLLPFFFFSGFLGWPFFHYGLGTWDFLDFFFAASLFLKLFSFLSFLRC